MTITPLGSMWVVTDPHGRSMFSGTLAECELFRDYMTRS